MKGINTEVSTVNNNYDTTPCLDVCIVYTTQSGKTRTFKGTIDEVEE